MGVGGHFSASEEATIVTDSIPSRDDGSPRSSTSGGLLIRFAVLGTAQVAGSALSFVTAVIITRVGGADVFGQISVGLSVLAYASLATNFGTDVSGVRMAAADPGRVGTMLPAIVLIRLFFAALSLATILALAPVLQPDPQGQVVLLIICASLLAVCFLPVWLPQGLENLKVTALCIFAPFAFTFVLTAFSALFSPTALGFAFSRFGGDALLALALSVWALRFYPRPSWSQIKSTIRDLIQQSGAIAGSQLVRGLAFLSDILVVSFFYQNAVVGHFSAAYRIYLLLVAVSAMYFIALFPKLARAAASGAEALKTELRGTLVWTVPTTAALTLVLLAAVPWLLPFAFGHDFSVAVPALQLLVVAAALNFAHKNYSRALIAIGHSGSEFRMTAIATFVGLTLKVVGTWQWGITGTALAILLGELFLLALLAWSTATKLKAEQAR